MRHAPLENCCEHTFINESNEIEFYDKKYCPKCNIRWHDWATPEQVREMMIEMAQFLISNRYELFVRDKTLCIISPEMRAREYKKWLKYHANKGYNCFMRGG